MSIRYVSMANHAVPPYHRPSITRRFCVIDQLKDAIVFQTDDAKWARNIATGLNTPQKYAKTSEGEGAVKRSWACAGMTAVVQMREGFTPWRTIAAFELESEAENYCFRKLMVERVDTFYRVVKVVD